jgi:hypothetical protein
MACVSSEPHDGPEGRLPPRACGEIASCRARRARQENTLNSAASGMSSNRDRVGGDTNVRITSVSTKQQGDEAGLVALYPTSSRRLSGHGPGFGCARAFEGRSMVGCWIRLRGSPKPRATLGWEPGSRRCGMDTPRRYWLRCPGFSSGRAIMIAAPLRLSIRACSRRRPSRLLPRLDPCWTATSISPASSRLANAARPPSQ